LSPHSTNGLGQRGDQSTKGAGNLLAEPMDTHGFQEPPRLVRIAMTQGDPKVFGLMP